MHLSKLLYLSEPLLLKQKDGVITALQEQGDELKQPLCAGFIACLPTPIPSKGISWREMALPHSSPVGLLRAANRSPSLVAKRTGYEIQCTPGLSHWSPGRKGASSPAVTSCDLWVGEKSASSRQVTLLGEELGEGTAQSRGWVCPWPFRSLTSTVLSPSSSPGSWPLRPGIPAWSELQRVRFRHL